MGWFYGFEFRLINSEGHAHFYLFLELVRPSSQSGPMTPLLNCDPNSGGEYVRGVQHIFETPHNFSLKNLVWQAYE